MYKRPLLLLFSVLLSTSPVLAEALSNQKVRTLPIQDFIETAVKNDSVFEEILIDELALRYSKDLQLPARDLILSIKSEYDFNLTQETSDPEATISLSKLFPYAGTSISAEYAMSPSGSETDSSEFTVLISQPIAENAFGKATVLQDKIIGAEIDVTRHQIVEAYEDYLATVMTVYHNWYSAHMNLEIGQSSYQQSLRLLDGIDKRRKDNIALPIDVNKVKIQVLAKKEDLISLKEKHENVLNFVKQTIRYEGDEMLEPVDPFAYKSREVSFDDDYERFVKLSRTYRVLDLLEKKSSLEVKRDADALLPSTNLLLGYTMEGEDLDIKNPDNLLFAGVSITWPFPGQEERAQYETSKIVQEKTKLSNRNKYVQLHTDLKNLFIQIEREKKLISTAEEKIELSESILKDETRNYTYGKVTLNDFIDAVNRVDESKFDRIIHSVQLRILMIEWMRMTDQLISSKDIKEIGR